MDIVKKPYEISLWEDELTWQRLELEPIVVEEKDYRPGKFFSQDPLVAGAIPYALDYNDYRDGQRYYRFKSNGKYTENSKPELVGLNEWKATGTLREVRRPGNTWDNDKWYTYSNQTKSYVEVDKSKVKTPQSDAIYYKDISDGYIPNVLQSFFKEIKIATIGSDQMETPARCVNAKLTRKVNGENTLVFTMYYRYWDDTTQEMVYNPFNPLMVNERKVKLRLGPAAESADDARCKWYDFIIKSVQENSETKAFTYTCKDQFVNELSKTGFEIELDNELENNMGTIDQLCTYILDGSDWKLDTEETEILKQFTEEPLYEVSVVDSGDAIRAVNIEDDKDSITINGKTIYVFYSNVNDKKPQWQFLILPDGETSFKTDDDLVIDKSYKNYIIDVDYGNGDYPNIVQQNINKEYLIKLSTSYRGQRLVRQHQTKYDSTIDKYVGVYKKSGDNKKYYGFSESEYKSSGAILNYAANPSNFTSTTGWQTDSAQLEYTIKTYPEGTLPSGAHYQSFLSFKNKDAWVLNTGIGGHRSSIGSFTKDKDYVLRIKYASSITGGVTYSNPDTALFAKICEYRFDDDSRYSLFNTVFDFKTYNAGQTNDTEKVENYIYMKATCLRSISKTELTDWDFKIGLFLKFEQDEVYIEDLQIFPFESYKDESGVERLCVPGGTLHSEIKTKYTYYLPNSEWTDISDLVADYEGYEPSSQYIQTYDFTDMITGTNEFTKVRSISAKESNRFNLIQELCEAFECWPRFTVKRNQITGQVYYGKDLGIQDSDAYRQQKFVSFHEFVGKDNYVGFHYGLNSKSIQRTIDSAAIVTKIIVKDNANEFAPNGFCSIARSSESPNKENFLLNFNHYYRHNLLDVDVVTNDLYVNANGYLGYYSQLKSWNNDRDYKIDFQAGLLSDIAQQQASYTTYKTSYDSAVEEQLIIVQDTARLVGVVKYTTSEKEEIEEIEKKSLTNDNFSILVPFLLSEPPEEAKQENWGSKGTYHNNTKLLSYWTKWCQCENIIDSHEPKYKDAERKLQEKQAQYDQINADLKLLAQKKRELNLQFYKKYSRFIQEGSWIKEDYVDHNLYYIDAESTLHTSAQPKVTYNISVIDISMLEGYEGYDFDIGDKTYVEDVEFFGWSLRDSSTPYREEIIVNEITTELDAPEKDQIKVQNYKTQFEDLFQRITASTQQAEYHTGEYVRAASAIQSNGTISGDILQNSLNENSLILQNTRDQSVRWDESGITTTCLSNPSQMVRVVSGGIFISNDGGQTWRTGVTGNGINTAYLTAGQINTNDIYIMNGDNAAFRWGKDGIKAYWQEGDTYNTNKYVLFDQNGLTGSRDKKNIFQLQWDGLKINTTKFNENQEEELIELIKIGELGEAYLPIDLDKDKPKQGDLCYIKDGSGNYHPDYYNGQEEVYKHEMIYGIRIKDKNEDTVLETKYGDGTLWLRKELHIGNDSTTTVQIGYLDEKRQVSVMNGQSTTMKDMHVVFRAGADAKNQNEDSQKFLIYEDGYFEARAGKIGEYTIGDINSVIKGLKKLDIFSKLGYNFGMDKDDNPNPAELNLTLITTGFELYEPIGSPSLSEISTYFEKNEDGKYIPTKDETFQENKIYYKKNFDVSWEGSATYEEWEQLSDEDQYTLTYNDFKTKASGSVYYVRAICWKRGEDHNINNIEYQDSVTITSNNNGEDAYLVVITSSNGSFFKGANKSTTLEAKIFKGGKLETETSKYEFKWYTTADPSKVLSTSNTLEVSSTSISGQATYVCDITTNGGKGENE